MTENETAETAVTVQRAFDAPPERAFDAWLDPAAVAEWMFPAETDEVEAVHLEPRVGGVFSFEVRRDDDVVGHVGRYLEIDRPRRLAFTWGIADDEGEDRVTVDVRPTSSGCDVTLTHELHPDWADFADRTADAWAAMLDSLADHLGEEGP